MCASSPELAATGTADVSVDELGSGRNDLVRPPGAAGHLWLVYVYVLPGCSDITFGFIWSDPYDVSMWNAAYDWAA